MLKYVHYALFCWGFFVQKELTRHSKQESPANAQQREIRNGPVVVERVFVRISKQHGFKPPILKEIVFLRSKGYNNVEIASSVGVSRNTVSHYLEKLREMRDAEMAEMISLVGMMMERHSRMTRMFDEEFRAMR